MPERDFIPEPERYELTEDAPYRFEITRRELAIIAGGVWLAGLTARPALAQSTVNRLSEDDKGIITLFSGKVEEGQGARTELAMAAAEELNLPLDRIRVQLADTDSTPSDGLTAGSRTTPSTVPAVRKAAADKRGGALKPVGEWKILGKPHHRLDARSIVTGEHQYPSDIVREGMLYGAILRPPAYGATLESVDAKATAKLPGVEAVVDGQFAGVTAPTSMAAREALDALAATAKWKPAPQVSRSKLFEHLEKTASNPRETTRGNIETSLESASKKLSASFEVNYVQHAPMEPRAAVAEWKDGRLTVWTGTSNPFSVRQQLAEAFRLKQEQVRVIVPDFGGGFGGKHTGEAAAEAARLAKETGKPVKVRWTRQEEFTWAYFRPAALVKIDAGLDASGKLKAWHFRNYNSGTAAIGTPYEIGDVKTVFFSSDTPLRQGSYRVLAATANNFAREAFMDELAEAAGLDALDFRIAHLENERLKNVLKAAADRFGWKERVIQKRPNRGVGLACGTEKNSVVAACVEIEVDSKTGAPKLLEIVEAYECGKILNPAGLRQQVEGCILMGLGPVLRESIDFENGVVRNPRFASYRVTRFNDTPKMDLIFLDRTDLEPAGAGETPIIAVAPAMANALYRATGRRSRRMPLTGASLK